MPRDFPRSRRIEDQIQRLLSDLIRTEVRDPRLSSAVITAVRITRDLSVAWVYYTVLQSDGEAPSLNGVAVERVKVDEAFVQALNRERGGS